MNTPEWLQPALYGPAAGAAALAIAGFPETRVINFT